MSDYAIAMAVAIGGLLVWAVSLQVRLGMLKIDVDIMRKHGIVKHSDQFYEAKDDYLKARVWCEHAVQDERKRTDALARALGYEWKRTEAKEGWEWKNPFYGSPFFKCDPFAGIDLSGHYVAPKPPTNRPTKKPTTRTAAKRGPQRRATH